ncbi:hypothetical protein BURCENBC7_AP0147 [Burkholderia cenocepacia BC7]|nr:uncharacterized protein BCN122_I1185 [Burkholderia cenocepacia]EPZ86730.1 hypothetical protein BURCENK562V_C1845 [Burkholderia cenocepacia K56-2Valvano]ERI28253.1 hypothetical protein BURCENBC7_AP0147 [Burkholderia cenocepacia BC7]
MFSLIRRWSRVGTGWRRAGARTSRYRPAARIIWNRFDSRV